MPTNQRAASGPESEPIDAVVFDIGRVLVRFEIGALYRKLIADPVRLDWFLREVVTERWHLQHDLGVPFAAMIAELATRFPQERALIEAYALRWLETLPGPVAGTAQLVERLAARGVPLFALTNFGADAWAMFRPSFPVLNHFADIVVSAHEGVAKPDPAIFAVAQRRFGYAAERMLFIDDNPGNVAAARACGWQAVHFIDAAGLEAELCRRGLLQDIA